jgi:hypothetical protein
MNNMTVNGAAFNNSFGLGGQPGDRTGVSPISMEAIEQVQVSIAPFDIAQGNFVGASVDNRHPLGHQLVARLDLPSLPQRLVRRHRSPRQRLQPGHVRHDADRRWAGAPIVKNTLFAFGNFENEKDARPLYSVRANTGGEVVGGNITRVSSADATALSAFLKSAFNYDTGSFDPATDNTPQKRGIVRIDYNMNANNKLFFNYVQLNSNSDNRLSGSTSAGIGRFTNATDGINYQNSNYKILENRKTAATEWNSVLGSTMSNTTRVTYSYSDEGRPQNFELFPFVDILQGGTAYLSFGAEPFTAEQRAGLQLVGIEERLRQVRQQARVQGRRPHRALPLRQRVLQLLQAGRVGLQHAGRVLHRRARRAGEPEPHDVAGHGAPLPESLHEPARTQQAIAAAHRALRRRLCRRQLAPEDQPDHHGGPALRRAGVREHGV